LKTEKEAVSSWPLAVRWHHLGFADGPGILFLSQPKGSPQVTSLLVISLVMIWANPFRSCDGDRPGGG